VLEEKLGYAFQTGLYFGPAAHCQICLGRLRFHYHLTVQGLLHSL